MDARRMRTQSTRYLKTARTKSVTFAEEVQKEEFEIPSTSSSSSSLSSVEDDKERQKEIQELEAEQKRKAKESDDERSDRSRSNTDAEPKPLVKKGVSFRTTDELKGDGEGKKKMSRFDSFASRTTSIFHIRRGVNHHPEPEEAKSPEQKDFVYANIIRVEDDEEEVQEKERENTIGTGVSYTSETTYIEQELGNKLLGSYKTNDNWYFNRSEKPKTTKINRRVVLCGLFILAGLLGLIIAVILVIPQPDKSGSILYDHTKVYVLVGSRAEMEKGTPGVCQYERKCTSDICNIVIERQEGCCVGCPSRKTNPEDDNCNFNVTVGWFNITELTIRQRVYLFASLDGIHFYQTGFAPPVVQKADTFGLIPVLHGNKTVLENTTISYANETVIPNACFSTANQEILLVSCLSPYALFDFTFKGFPAQYCTSFRGICYNTNNALISPMKGCVPVPGKEYFEWEGNRWDTQKEWKANYEDITPLHNTDDIKSADRPKVEMETLKSNAVLSSSVSCMLLVAAAVTLFL